MTATLPEPEELAQAGQRAAVLQELVTTQLLGSSTTLDVHTQTHTQECLELFAELLGLLQSRCAVGGDEVECFEWLFVEIWWFGLDHFDSHDTE